MSVVSVTVRMCTKVSYCVGFLNHEHLVSYRQNMTWLVLNTNFIHEINSKIPAIVTQK